MFYVKFKLLKTECSLVDKARTTKEIKASSAILFATATPCDIVTLSQMFTKIYLDFFFG